MGNRDICGADEDKKQNLLPESKIILCRTIKNVTISIIQADIVEEVTDALVNASHEPSDSYIAKRDKNSKTKEQLMNIKIGDLVTTDAANVNATEIYHVRLPLYQEPRDLLKIYNSYRNCLSQRGFKTISFTDQNTPNFAVPKQYVAEVMLRAFLNYINDTNAIPFEHIKFVSLDQLTLKYFTYELTKQLDEQRIPSLAQSRYESFINFISNDDSKQEAYMLSTGITSEQD